ncbi:protein APCDD1-like [Euwallacea fornicatus]|uniref:protein APCDD1-like n=1 Tax=Euwallacea fornicatus TaxID=995702 RepID=UPI00338EA1E7
MLFIVLIFCLTRAVTSNSNCQEVAAMAALEDGSTVVDTRLDMLAGTWISEGCETRPGPEYALRHYTFDNSGKFHLTQHHYWDDSCSLPLLTIQAFGKIQFKGSLVQPGAACGNFKFTNITIIPQDDNAVRELDKRASFECPGQTWKSWRKYEEHPVCDSRYDENNKKTFNLWLSSPNSHYPSVNSKGSNMYFSDISCLGSLKWAFNELKLLKVQLRPLMEHFKKTPREVKMELLLGDIHSNARLRQYYNPSSFQVPLVQQIKEHTEIVVNRHTYIVKNTQAIPPNIFTNPKTPPHLIEKPPLPPYIWGQWTSTRCESRPGGTLYLTRRFSFYSDDSSWIGEHNFYSDPFCRIPKFIVTAAGHFKLQGLNYHLKRTSSIDFYIEKASLTVLDSRMIYDLGLSRHCGVGEWEVNVPKELSTTGGCMQLGIFLPSVQYDVVKLEMDYKGSCLLFLGQVDTDNVQLNDVTKRPTAFQKPLVKCGEVPTYSRKLWEILNEGDITSGSWKQRGVGLWLVIGLFFPVCAR